MSQQQQQQQRPVYVPKRKRQLQQQSMSAEVDRRVAAYFRSDDYVEHDEPPPALPSSNNNNNNQRHVQKPEDYMDEQDHNEWGGPVNVRREYRGAETANQTKTKAAVTGSESINDIFFAPPTKEIHHNDSIGKRLLKQLGWRGNSSSVNDGTITAYIPATATSGLDWEHDDTTNDSTIVHLSNKRWRKIVKQQRALVVAPEPWKGTIGLGYVSLQNAPEFQAFRAARQRHAQQRAVASSHSSNNNKNNKSVYRVANILPGVPKDDGDDDDSDMEDGQQQSNIAAYETTTREDFVGTKSSAGFCLRDDEDDAYDDDEIEVVSDYHRHPFSSSTNANVGIHALTVYQGDGGHVHHPAVVPERKIKVSKAHFDTVAYEHVDSDHEEDDAKPRAQVADFGGVLSSWATAAVVAATSSTRVESNLATAVATTGGGDTPLPGFVLGGSGQQQQHQYYRGPDVPKDWMDKPHVFGPTEHPSIFKALSHAVQLQVAQERHQTALDEALQAATVKATLISTSTSSPIIQPPRPQHNNVFTGVGAAIKSRFTVSAAAAATAAVETDSILTSGLSRQGDNDNDARPSASQESPSMDTPLPQQQPLQDYSITRTILPFHPESLLCKRFSVTIVPSVNNGTTAGGFGRTREEAYFYDEIMAEAKSFANGSEKRNVDTTISKAAHIQLFNELESTRSRDVETTANRPPLAVYKSIFEPESENEASSTTSDDDGYTQSINNEESDALVMAADRSLAAGEPGEAASRLELETEISEALVPYNEKEASPDTKEKRRKQKDRDGRNRERKRRSRSLSSEDRRERRRSKDDRHRRDEKKSKKDKKKRKKSRHRDSD